VGAAVRDIVKVLRTRWPGIRIVLAPVRVQGEGAAAEIAAAIQRFDRWGGADLLIAGRGGGSIEDLWAFNEEVVVRAIAAASTPIVSAVGHEVDTTLADLAADVRAATPSNAAELAVRDVTAVRRQLNETIRRVDLRVRARLDRLRHSLDTLLERHGFRRIKDLFEYWQQRMDELRDRLDARLRGRLTAARERLSRALVAYGLRQALRRRIAEARAKIEPSRKRLTDRVVTRILDERRRAISLEKRLLGLSPREVLKRGYALVKGPDGMFVRSAEAIAVGDGVTLEFARGEADATVTTIRKGGSDAAREGRRRRE
jgi:exodeoxyribonuclease VII large subunit